MSYNKLVRDKIVDKIKANGEIPQYHILNDKEYKKELIKKLLEECMELIEALNSSNRDDIQAEEADVMEVIKAINNLLNIDEDEVLKFMDKKREKNGGFAKRLFLEDVKQK